MSLLERLGWLLDPSTPHHVVPRTVAELLGALRDQLGMHFALEEAFGYFEDAVDVAPRLSDRCATLRSQHVPLFVTVCQLAEQADRVAYGEASLHALRWIGLRFQAFHDQFQAHEAREIDLILQAFQDDLGGEC